MSRTIYFIFLAGIFISTIFLVYFFRDADFGKLKFDNINYKFIFLAILFNFIGLFFRAKKFCISVNSYNKKNFEIKSIFIGSFFNLILPFRFGEVIRAYYLGNKRNESRVFYFSAIIVERFFDVVFLCLFLICIFLIFNFNFNNTNFNTNSFFILIIITLTLVIIFSLFLKNNKILLKNLNFCLKIFNKKINLKLRSILWILNLSFREIQKMNFLYYLTYSLLQWFFSILSIYLLCQSLGVNLDLNNLFLLVLITYLSLMIPSGPGFAGSYQLPVLLFFISNNFSNDVAYQYAFISWIFLVLMFALIGAIVTLFEKKYIFQINIREISNYSKWIPSVKESLNYEKILNNFFSGNKDVYFFNDLILKEKMPVIKDLGGGSSSYTFLSKKDNRKFVRKWSPALSSKKLEMQHEFIQNQNHKNLPKIFGFKKFENTNSFFYDMQYYENYQNGFDFFHNNSEIECKKLLNNISNYILSFEKSVSEHKYEIVERYIVEKLYENIELLKQRNLQIRDFLKYDFFFLNGKKYLNYRKIRERLNLNKKSLIEDLSKYPSKLGHGDTTIDNLLVKDPDEFKIVDPNYNYLNSPLLDFAKMKQSLNSGYEFLMQNKDLRIVQNKLNFNFNKSERYEVLNKHLDLLLNSHFENIERSILIHEAIHYARLLIYKDNINSSKTIIYLSIMLKILNEYVELY